MGSGAAIGSVLGGRYRLVSVLGTGSMSTVYRAEADDGATVAVKVLKSKIHNPQAATERLFREARVISRLEHPGCVRLHDWGVDEGQPFVVLELMEGEALNEAMRRWETLTPAKAVAIMAEVCDVLAAAHDLGVVHRDLKPGNIMLLAGDTGVRVKVLDFGLARLTPKKNPDETQPKELTRPGSTLGTPSYMAPEQVRGSHVDGRADVYAVGVILYELVTGTLPIIGETAIDTMLKQATDAPTPILDVAPDLDPATAALIMRCLEKSPDARYQSAPELKAALLEHGPDLTFTEPTKTFVRDELPLSSAPTERQKRPVLPKPKAPPRTKRPPPPKKQETRQRAETDTAVQGEDADRTLMHKRSTEQAPPRLPLPLPTMPQVRVMEADREATKLHRRIEPDLSEMEVTIPAHGSAPLVVRHEEHEMERTIPVTSMKSSEERATGLHDMADWASTQKIKRVREEDLNLPDATRPMRIRIEGPPPSRPSNRGHSGLPSGGPSGGPSGAPSGMPTPNHQGSPPSPPIPPPPRMPSMRRHDISNVALNEVLSGIPNDERKWLLAAAIAGLAISVILAIWLLL